MPLQIHLNCNYWFKLLVYHIKSMFVTKKSPYDSHIFNKYIEGDCTKCSTYAQEKFEHSKPVQGERLHNSKNIHIYVDSTNKCTDEIHQRWTRDGAERSQHDIGC